METLDAPLTSETDNLILRTFEPGDEVAFRVLNEAWIEKYFRLEPTDREVLNNPHKKILSRGGDICVVQIGEFVIGCCALLPIGDDEFELAKMAVAEHRRGQGIGRKLLQFTIDHARTLGARRLYLETNSSLPNAIHLYAALGFKHLPTEKIKPSKYARADVYMEMYL